jgi:Transposase DNA-binding
VLALRAARFLPPPYSVLGPSGLRAEWREAVATGSGTSSVTLGSDASHARLDWAQDVFGDAELGDVRRTTRLVCMAAEPVRQPSGRLSEVYRSGLYLGPEVTLHVYKTHIEHLEQARSPLTRMQADALAGPVATVQGDAVVAPDRNSVTPRRTLLI